MKEQFLNTATRVILGESTEEETQAFLVELEDSPENKAEFEEMQKAWEMAADYERPSFVASDWSLLEEKLTPATKAKSGFLSFSFQKMAIAASLALVAAVSWVLWVQVFSWENVEALSSNQEIILPDNSHIVLKRGSELRYKKNFASNRSIQLKGEAWFEVTKDPSHPFTIETNATMTTVLGTAFDIREWPDESRVEIRVTEGKVSFQGGEQTLLLEAGMAAAFDQKTNALSSIAFGSMNQVNWMKNQLHFDNTDIHTTLSDIAHYYDVEIDYQLPDDYCPLSGDYGLTTKEDMLQILNEVLELDIEVQNNRWVVKKGTCHK
ncbi:MAG: FecR domain-containing protein [Bacteroidota bacterium]|nr:FecR domain-containing protein [Bacteroidota bacterium]MDX5431070.1 FecR domain-containing protein [Bacteroidota bacterium]MDX5469824.1 FecR domain-containing protein [Bacteroidota bacterium]